MWEGRTVHVLGGGPSLKKVNWDEIDVKGKRFIGVNNSYGDPVYDSKNKLLHYEPRRWVQVLWFGDSRWHDWHRDWAMSFPGIRVHCVDRLEGKKGYHRLLRGRKMYGIDETPGRVAWNRNSGASAINLAWHLGAKRVVLYGFDMHDGEKGEGHWHNDHQVKQPNPYYRFLKCFPFIAKDAEVLGMEIVNATPGSAIDVFPIMDPMETLGWL